jgi:general secretion pathway protein L
MSRWLGLDISPESVRLALVRSTYRRTAVEALREERISDHETQSAAIRAAMAGLKCDAVASSLAGDRAFLRMISLPATAAKEIEAVLPFEVESTLPFELDEAVMDHRMLRRIPDVDPDGHLPILAGVGYTEEVRNHIGLVLRGTGHEPQRVGLGALPLANLVQLIPELQRPLVAILDLGEQHADLLIMRHGEPRFSRAFTQGISGPNAASVVARELRQSIGAWRVQGGPKPEALYVVGVGRSTPGLEDFVQAQVGLPVLDLPKPSVEGLSADQYDSMPRFAKALGLAMGLSRRAVDLDVRQGSLQAQQSFQFLRDRTPLLSGLAAAIFVSFGFSVFAETQALDSERAALEGQLEQATLTAFGEGTTDPTRADELLEAAIKGKTGDPMPKMDAFDVIVELSERIPKDMVHDIAEFEYSRGEVTIRGIVPSISDSNLVKDVMAEHECFKGVNITGTTQLKNQDKQKYTLQFSVACAGEGKTKKKKKKGKKKASDKGGKK